MLFNIITYLSFISTVLSIASIEVKGNAFWNSETGERFYIRGIDYQAYDSNSVIEDPIADTASCERDIKYFNELGINTVRIYSIDNTKNHTECMDKLAENGIYVILDVNTPHSSITRSNANCSYNSDYLREIFATIQEFAIYDNTLGFFAGNEVINDGPSLEAAPYVKAVVRDIKTFIKNRNFRTIPVGYSAASVDEYRLSSALYFNCGDDDLARIDMFGINDYSWCGDASMTTSQYSNQMKDFANYTIPIFFSEYGCNTKRPRPFSEVEVIYSNQMSSVFSGGLVYEYFEEENNYGLVELNDGNIETNEDFDNLKNEFNKTKNPSGDGGYNKNGTANNCPSLSNLWNVTTKIPNTPAGAIAMLKGLEEVKDNHGFDAYTQNCDGHDETDDSDQYSSTIGASSRAAIATTGGSSSISSASSSSTQTSSGSSSKQNDGLVVSVDKVMSLIALIAGVFTI
ncbi:gel1 [Candida pseudojiufengensis]|uniref:gel1 n=1 Tax=Candida pseudojiufengensis TaxID=497109 RepID=UPI0022246509|nr:gel1 [Candida pseudojiufengensis]KAI5958684.1 gel1 [Candida pseudojiufengensis]